MPLAVPEIHAHQHLRPIGCVDSARFRSDGDKRLPIVVLPRQQRAHFEIVDVPLESIEFRQRFVLRALIVLRLCQLEKDGKVIGAGSQFCHSSQLSLQE